ncbi:thiamine phosphate synthase [Kocuria sp. ZOR0020]|uniref:thiamine phosphate synthase n=1 Tax=Kocuria sp. ZOR0020 TaxID=1339234 RepID=UPI000645F712|nr:thiamine phosphate synthase [Kocuria sp. ZOR0020]
MSPHNHFSADDLLLYLVTDTELSAPRSVAEVVEAAVAGGVTMVQVRSKTMGGRDLLDLTCQVAQRVGHRVPVLVDDRVDVYLAARNRGEAVAGVHVGQSDPPVRDVRAICGPEAVVGLSVATPEEFVTLDQLPAGIVDYAGIGAVHATQTKPDHPEPLGVEGFARARSLCSVPAVAIGGVKVQDATPLMEAGADGLAVVSGICAADDPQQAARAYREVIGR